MKKTILTLAFLILVSPAATAQQFPSWEGYPPMNNIKDVIEFEGDVYAATAGGFFRFHPDTGEYDLFYKNNGLISNDVLCLGATSRYIYLGFRQDGLWRFDPNTDAFTHIIFPEYHFKTDANKNGIAVNDIFAVNDSILYIAHQNGIDRLNVATEDLRAYTKLGPALTADTAVYAVAVFDSTIWAGTQLGLAIADYYNPNLEFQENWTNYLYGQKGITSVIRVMDRENRLVFLGTNGAGIVEYAPEVGGLIATNVYGAYIYDMAESNGKYYAGADRGLYVRGYSIIWNIGDERYAEITALAAGTEGRLWVGTMFDGLQCYTDSGYVDIPRLNDMKSTTFYDLDIDSRGVLWAATGNRDSNPYAVYQRLQDGVWTSYDLTDGRWTNKTVATLCDSRGLVWVAKWGNDGSGIQKSGIIVIDDDGTQEKTDDLLIEIDPDMEIFRPTLTEFYVVCSDLDEDVHGNIWVANYQEDNNILTPIPTSGAVVLDGYPPTKIAHYSPAEDGLPTATIMKLCTDPDGWVWLGTWQQGIMALYVGDDPFDKSDTKIRVLNLSDGLLGVRINALACAQDSSIWVGTTAGLNRIRKENGDFTVDDMNECLPDGDREIQAIEIDPYGEVWVGTTGGLYKVNAQHAFEYHYTTDNSGLFSNSILSLKYEAGTDILWVGTAAGVNRLSVHRFANGASDREIRVYPNPFEIWGTDSRAVFRGLKPGSPVRIFSFTGEQVTEISAATDDSINGSEAIWTGKNFEGRFVASGVYFFTGTDVAGRPFRDKLVVVRR